MAGRSKLRMSNIPGNGLSNPVTDSQTAGLYLGDIMGVEDVLAGKSSQIGGVKNNR